MTSARPATMRRWRAAALLGAGALLGSLAAPGAVHGQRIEGRVVEDGNHAPIRGVQVAALDTAGTTVVSVLTDSIGGFTLTLVPGRYALRLERFGYASLTTEPLDLVRRERLVLELRLGAEAIALEPLVVITRVRPPVGAEQFYRRMAQYRQAGIGRFITRAQIDSTSFSNVHMLLARDPVVRILRARFNDVVAFQTRGTTCLPALHIDGVPIENHAETDLSAWIQPDQIEGIEIYPVAAFAPPELRAEGCGAIAIWTQSGSGNPFTTKRLMIAGGFVAAVLLLLAID